MAPVIFSRLLGDSGPRRSAALIVCVGVLAAACDGGALDDHGSGASSTGSATTSTGTGGGSSTSASGSSGSGSGSGSSSSGVSANCIADGHAAGERYAVGDHCNFCTCNADGSSACTARTCPSDAGSCTYDKTPHAYGEHFPSIDECNDCVCAASGLACTRRPCTTIEEGAILAESLDKPCGDDPTFTAESVLDGLFADDLLAPFPYRTVGDYPETLPDTMLRFRIVYEGGFAVCRIPAPGQEAWDIEVVVEWMTADGSFDEGFHTYLRKNMKGFTDVYSLAFSAPPNGLDGTFDPACLDPNGFSFGVTLDNETHTVGGSVDKVCETDIPLVVGSFTYP